MSKDRFEFGKNWKGFLQNLDDEKILIAMYSLRDWLQVDNLKGKSFLDIGSGSGLFSLAAKKLGASVVSFDYDDNCVSCTSHLRERFYPGDSQWVVERGDILDEAYMSKFDKFDVVYSWGVLHHTGNMYMALNNASSLVKKGGKLYIAIYNDQYKISSLWKKIKKTYNVSPFPINYIILMICFLVSWGPIILADLVRFRPLMRWKNYKKKRGMSPWYDVVDWVGGYPFEVATPENIFEFVHERGFQLEKLFTCGSGHGCNQYVFVKTTTD